MILITGATGHFGKAAIQHLLKKGGPPGNITALVRDKAKGADLAGQGIALRKADYNNYDELVTAFAGVDKLLFVSASDITNRGPQQANVVKAAITAGVKYILYTSFERKNETSSSPIAILAKAHVDTETALQASGIPHTIFRNNIYLDFLPNFLGDKVFEQGVFWPAGDSRSAFAIREDMAEAAANVLLSEGHEYKTYYISNSENISFADVAETLSRLSGKQVAYIDPSQEVYKATMIKAGVPENYVQIFAGFAEAIKQGEFYAEKSDLESLLGRKPVGLEAFLKTTSYVS